MSKRIDASSILKNVPVGEEVTVTISIKDSSTKALRKHEFKMAMDLDGENLYVCVNGLMMSHRKYIYRKDSLNKMNIRLWDYITDFYKFKDKDLLLTEVRTEDGQVWEFGTGIAVEDKAEKTIKEFYVISLMNKDSIRGTDIVLPNEKEAIKYVKEYNEKNNPKYEFDKWIAKWDRVREETYIVKKELGGIFSTNGIVQLYRSMISENGNHKAFIDEGYILKNIIASNGGFCEILLLDGMYTLRVGKRIAVKSAVWEIFRKDVAEYIITGRL